MAVHRINRAVAATAAGLVVACAAAAPAAQAAIPAASYSFSPKPLDAGEVTVGGTKQVTIFATNNGPGNLGFVPTAVTPANAAQAFSQVITPFDLATGQECVTNAMGQPVINALPPGQSCRLLYTFAPRGTSGAKTATANITVTAYAEPGAHYAESAVTQKTTVAMKGKALPLKLLIDPAALQFATHTVGYVEEQSVTITNRNDVNIAFAPGGVAPAPAQFRTDAAFGDDLCAQTTEYGLDALVLGPGQSCRVPVRFAPTAPGAKTGTIKVNMFIPTDGFEPGYRDNVAGRAPVASATFKATGKAVAVSIQVNQAARKFPVSFGNVPLGTQSIRPAIAFNPGDTPLSVVTDGLSGGFDRLYPTEFEYEDSCYYYSSGVFVSRILPPRGYCLLYYRFRPAGSAGARTGTTTVRAWTAGAPSGVEPTPYQQKPNATTTVQLKGTATKP